MDIRSFFGKGKPAAGAQAKPKQAAKRSDPVSLEDSDDEGPSVERSRLNKGRRASPVKPPAEPAAAKAPENTPKRKVRDDDESSDEVLMTKVVASPLKKEKAASPATKKPRTAAAKEAVDPSAYFGGSPTAGRKPLALRTSPSPAKKGSPAVRPSSTPSRSARKATPPSRKRSPPAKPASAAKGAARSAAKEEAPAGLPLSGEVFVFTGVLYTEDGEMLEREKAQAMVTALGARTTSAVSGKTTCLVTGDSLEDGRKYTEGSKYKKAKGLGTRIMANADFLAFLAAKGEQLPKKAAVPDPVVAAPPPAPSSAPREEPVLLWADKYAPKRINDLVGNRGAVMSLGRWLESWHHVHITGRAPKPKYNRQNPGAKAALLSGPPGIGKSTTAALVAFQCGYEVYELNASDKRSKKLLQESLAACLGSGTIRLGGGAQRVGRRVVIMDEVDGMSSGDRGGTAELIDLLKRTRTPVIAICNDRQSPKVRSLANHCFDIKFARPEAPDMALRMQQIAALEGVKVERDAALCIAETTGGDMRQAVHALQMHVAHLAGSGEALTLAGARARLRAIEKDGVLRLTPHDACRKILQTGAQPFMERFNAYFVDYSFVPLLVAQHYLTSINNNQRVAHADRLDAAARASEALSDAEVVTAMIQGADSHWELLPASAALHVRVGHHCGGGLSFPGFPEWLVKNSRRRKRLRLAGEFGARLAHGAKRACSGGAALVMDTAELLRDRLLAPLREGGADGAMRTVRLLDELGLSRDDLFEHLAELQWCEQLNRANPYDEIDSKTKSAFTRLYNKQAHKAQALGAMQKVTKGRGRKRKKEDEDGAAPEEDDEDDEDDDAAEDLSAFQKKKAAKKAAAKKKAPAKRKKK